MLNHKSLPRELKGDCLPFGGIRYVTCLDEMWFKVMLLHVLGSNVGLINTCPPLTSMPTSVLQPTPLPLVPLETSHGDTWFEEQK